MLLVELIALKTCWAFLFFLFPDFLSPFSEKSTTSNKNPSKPPVILVPPKAPEDKTPNTHFGVVIHDRGRCRRVLLCCCRAACRRRLWDVSQEVMGPFCRGDSYCGVHDRAVLNRSHSSMFRCGLLCFFLPLSTNSETIVDTL